MSELAGFFQGAACIRSAELPGSGNAAQVPILLETLMQLKMKTVTSIALELISFIELLLGVSTTRLQAVVKITDQVVTLC